MMASRRAARHLAQLPTIATCAPFGPGGIAILLPWMKVSQAVIFFVWTDCDSSIRNGQPTIGQGAGVRSILGSAGLCHSSNPSKMLLQHYRSGLSANLFMGNGERIRQVAHEYES